MRLAKLSMTIVLVAAGVCWGEASSKDYAKTLEEMGAVRVSTLTKPFFSNGRPGKVYSKGDRVDVVGWLPPEVAGDYLTEDERTKLGIPKAPWDYGRLVKNLDVAAYEKTKDKTLFVLMQFSLRQMLVEDARKEDIVPVFEAKVGLEGEALRLLGGKLTSVEAMALWKKHGDDRLMWIMPAPARDDAEYLKFLNERILDSKCALAIRSHLFGLLYAMDEKSYRTSYRDFLLEHAQKGEDWWVRAGMYEKLIGMKGAKCYDAVGKALLNDPVTECRESILRHLQEAKVVTPVIDAVGKAAKGEGAECHSEGISRPAFGEWPERLGEYLKWAEKQEELDRETKGKLKDALADWEGVRPRGRY